MKKPKLSIIIITLNEEDYLPELLDSLRSQTFQDFEVILADFNSVDKTREIAEDFGCIITEGGGFSKGRNNGAKLAKAEYLFFVDADCTLPEDFFEINLNKFIESGKSCATTEVKPISNKIFDKVFFKFYDIFSRVMQYFSPVCCGGSIFVKKETFEKLNGFNEDVLFAENFEFTERCMPYGFCILPRAMFTSVRRLDGDGRWKFVFKYLYAWVYRMFKEINTEIFNYAPYRKKDIEGDYKK